MRRGEPPWKASKRDDGGKGNVVGDVDVYAGPFRAAPAAAIVVVHASRLTARDRQLGVYDGRERVRQERPPASR